MNPDRLLAIGLAQLWQLSLVIVMVAPIAWLLRRRRPHWAYALWLLVLIKCVTPPLWSSPTGVFCWLTAGRAERLEIAANEAPRPATAAQGKSASNSEPAAIPADEPQPASAAFRPAAAETQSVGPPISIPAVILALWAASAVAMVSIVAAIALAMLRRIERTAQEPPAELTRLFAELRATIAANRRVRLVVSSTHCGPALVGLVRPRIVLPAVLVKETPSGQLTPIIAHELVHLRRGDHWIAHLQLLAQAIWWFNPLVWWANRELSRAREMSCDEEVLVTLDCEPIRYAQTLLDVVRLRRQMRPMPLALSMRPAQFAAMRLSHITSGSLRFHRRTPWACWATIGLAALVLLPGAGLLASGDKKAADETLVRTVVDGSTQKPLAGVNVRVDHEISTPEGQKVITTTRHVTDKQGKYEIKLPAAELDHPTLGLRFYIDQPGYAPPQQIYYGVQYFRRAIAHGVKSPFDVDRIYPGEEVSGVIEDPDGKPLADLPVNVISTVGQGTHGFTTSDPDDEGETGNSFVVWGSQPVTSHGVMRTDAQGRFRFNALKGGIAQVWVEPTGYAALTRSFGMKRGDVGRIILDRGVPVAGRVVDTEGKPVADVWVNVSPVGPRNASASSEDYTMCASKTDREGNFRTEPVHPGDYVAKISAHDPKTLNGGSDGSLPAVFERAKVSVPADQPETRLEIKAIPHYTIKAHFTDGAGKPFAGGKLTINARRHGHRYLAVVDSDAQGLAEARVPRDLDSIIVETLGGDQENVYRQRQGKDGELWNMTEAHLGDLDGDADDLYYVRYRSPNLWFTTIDPAGKPILDATAKIDYLTPDGKFDVGLPVRTHLFPVGNKGDWNTLDLLPGQQFLLTVDAPGHQPQSYKLQLAEGESQELKVVLKR